MSCNIKPNYQKEMFENEKHPKEKPKEKGFWPKIKGTAQLEIKSQ